MSHPALYVSTATLLSKHAEQPWSLCSKLTLLCNSNTQEAPFQEWECTERQPVRKCHGGI